MMRWFMALTTLVFLTAARPVHATYQIGQFFNDGGAGITWTNSGNTSGSLTGTEGGYFTFTNLSGVPSGPQVAKMTITANTTTDGSTLNGELNQPLNGSVTVDITNTSGQHLLTAVVSPGTAPNFPALTGTGSSAAVVAATPRDNVTFSSDFFNASTLNSQAFTVGLSAITPTLSFNTTGGHSFLNNFTSSASALFSANTAVPEPASVALLGVGCIVLVGARRRFGRVAG